jgi:carboxymethylenebutenolidase
MGTNMRLTAADGHQFDTYAAKPSSPAKAAVVVIQEIFGVNSHIRAVADDYAEQGFLALAPALFDRAKREVELGYNPADMSEGIRLATQIGLDAALKDVAAAIEEAKREIGNNCVGAVGYCFGGTLAWLAATRLGPAAAVCYYGGRIAQHASERPTCPVMLHFGARDPHIPLSEIDAIRGQNPELPVFTYDAGHGFNCDQRKDYQPEAAALARERTLEFLRKHLLTADRIG